MCKIRYPIFGEKRKERVEKMAQEEKQMEKMKQEIKKIFEKEGEMGYITLNLVETKEKLCKPKRKSEEEKEALSKAYQQILEEEKTTRKQTCGLFQNTEEGRREKANILNRIHQEYWEFESQFGKIKGLAPKKEKDLVKWENNLEEIENLVATEFSVPSLEKIEELIKTKNQTAFAQITQIQKITRNNKRFIPWKVAFGEKK